jgi:hypothetical protein
MPTNNTQPTTDHARSNGLPVTVGRKRLASEHALVIDPEFRALCPRQSAQLERSLLAEGCRDDLVAWKPTKDILDGNNRHPICERHGIPFGVVFLDLPDRDACKRWIVANQMARRNISSQGVSYLRGTRHLLEKQPHGGNHGNGDASYHRDNLTTGQARNSERGARNGEWRDAERREVTTTPTRSASKAADDRGNGEATTKHTCGKG